MEKTIVGHATSQQKRVEQLTPYLRIQSPGNTVYRLRLSTNNIILGRGKNCDLTLDDEMISREHLQVWLDEIGNIHVLDLNSTNGSKIDNKKFQQIELLPHNRIKIGRHIIKIEYKDSEEIRQEELLQSAATSDPLTGISNRKWFEERVNQIAQAIVDNNQYLAIIMIDIDHFKKVNDTYGHQTGDVVIKGVAEILNSCKRQQDLLARFGGEEFIVCLPGCNSKTTKLFCERVREEIARTKFRFAKEHVNVTVSLGGCAKTVAQSFELSNMISIADKALYTAKQSGRNQSTISMNI